jgi:hypothetical protein
MGQFRDMPTNAQRTDVGHAATASLNAQNIICGSLGPPKFFYVNSFNFVRIHGIQN